MEATEDVHDIQELPHGGFFLKIGCCVYACICVLKFSSILVNGGRHFTWQRSYITAYSDLSCCESPSDGDTLHDSVRKTAAYSNHSRCPSKSPSDSVEETAAYSNYSCCPSKSPSDRDNLHDSVEETAAYSNHSCCPCKSPSDRDKLHVSVWETAAYSKHSCCPSQGRFACQCPGNSCVLKPLMLSQ